MVQHNEIFIRTIQIKRINLENKGIKKYIGFIFTLSSIFLTIQILDITLDPKKC